MFIKRNLVLGYFQRSKCRSGGIIMEKQGITVQQKKFHVVYCIKSSNANWIHFLICVHLEKKLKIDSINILSQRVTGQKSGVGRIISVPNSFVFPCKYIYI